MTLKTQIQYHITDANLAPNGDGVTPENGKALISLVECGTDIKTEFTVYGCDEGGYFRRDYNSLDGLKAGLERINSVHIEAIEQTTTTKESMTVRINDRKTEVAQCEMILANKATD